MTKTVGVVLSGCGYLDGAEIQESIVTLIALDRAGVAVRCFAPDLELDEVDHRSGAATGGRRNVLAEAARIARGKIEELGTANAEELDALALPGGFGAALNLSNFAKHGAECEMLPPLSSLIQAMHEARKPIAAICIAPALLARALGPVGPELTIGNDAGTAEALQALGAKHRDCAVDGIVVDEANRIVTTPAYMYEARRSEIATGIEKCIGQLVAWL